MSFQVQRLAPDRLERAAGVLVWACAQPPWSEAWTLAAALENLSYVLGTPRSIALGAVDGEEVLGIALGI